MDKLTFAANSDPCDKDRFEEIPRNIKCESRHLNVLLTTHLPITMPRQVANDKAHSWQSVAVIQRNSLAQQKGREGLI